MATVSTATALTTKKTTQKTPLANSMWSDSFWLFQAWSYGRKTDRLAMIQSP